MSYLIRIEFFFISVGCEYKRKLTLRFVISLKFIRYTSTIFASKRLWGDIVCGVAVVEQDIADTTAMEQVEVAVMEQMEVALAVVDQVKASVAVLEQVKPAKF